MSMRRLTAFDDPFDLGCVSAAWCEPDGVEASPGRLISARGFPVLGLLHADERVDA